MPLRRTVPTIGGGDIFLTELRGYLDHLRENLEVLDEQIAIAPTMSKPKRKGDNALQWSKTLRDLVELRNTTLEKIKSQLLGRDETGTVKEPSDSWGDNDQVEFERYFKNMLSPWTQKDLSLECEDCKVNSEAVTHRQFANICPPEAPWSVIIPSEEADLCPECAAKREVSRQQRAAETERPA